MKKVYALGLGLLFLASCSSDDGGGSTIDVSQLTKKWYLNTTIVEGQTIPYDDHEDCGKDYLEFVEGGQFRQVDVWECEEYVEEAVWALDGNTITISLFGQSVSTNIVTLTATVFEVENAYDFDGDGDEEMVRETYTSN